MRCPSAVSRLELRRYALGLRLEPERPAPGAAPANLQPRCDDAIFRARGECVDTGAGLKKNDLPALRSRELMFLRKEERMVVASPPQSTGPFSYQFRIAHR